jgi:hypothetical protein
MFGSPRNFFHFSGLPGTSWSPVSSVIVVVADVPKKLH